MSPPANDTYTTLKTELVRRLSASRNQRVRQLLMHEEMEDRKHSQFLRHLKSLSPEVPDDFVRNIWSSRLLTHIQTIQADQSEGNLGAASQLADRIAEVAPLLTTASITRAPDSAELLQKIEDLSRHVAALSSQVATLSSDRTRHRTQSRDRRKANDVPAPVHGSADSGYCS